MQEINDENFTELIAEAEEYLGTHKGDSTECYAHLANMLAVINFLLELT